MIGRISGEVIWRDERGVIVETGASATSGIGYRIFLSGETLREVKIGDVVALWTHLAVRENALDLYGFAERRELQFFELLISVSGIGPKSALAILSLAPPATLEKAITRGDAGYLTRVSGIGKKSAEKIVLELKDKLGAGGDDGTGGLGDEAEAVEALAALGYSLRQAREALRQTPEELTDTAAKVKAALRILGGQK